jgi:TonB family protein
MGFHVRSRYFAVSLLLLSGWAATCAAPAWGQQEIKRKAMVKVAPVCPELARRMNIAGVVKVLVTVAPSGAVKNATLIGGHPVLANAALQAVKQWHFEPGPGESTGIVQFRFDPQR